MINFYGLVIIIADDRGIGFSTQGQYPHGLFVVG